MMPLPKLTELAAEREILNVLRRWLNVFEDSRDLSADWASSKLPRMPITLILGAASVTICKRCTSEVPPSGYRRRHGYWHDCEKSPARPGRCPRWLRSKSGSAGLVAAPTPTQIRPNGCNAMSLKARVGPWYSSLTNNFSSSLTTGTGSVASSKPSYKSSACCRICVSISISKCCEQAPGPALCRNYANVWRGTRGQAVARFRGCKFRRTKQLVTAARRKSSRGHHECRHCLGFR